MYSYSPCDTWPPASVHLIETRGRRLDRRALDGRLTLAVVEVAPLLP